MIYGVGVVCPRSFHGDINGCSCISICHRALISNSIFVFIWERWGHSSVTRDAEMF